MNFKSPKCTIEHHAVIFALLAKHAVSCCGDDGRNAILEGVKLYGRQRGERMAANARSNGDPADIVSNQAYGEWIPDYEGQMTFGRLRNEPTLRTFISKCAWCEAWQKHGLIEHGKLYCLHVDNAVYEGFQSGNDVIYECHTLDVPMSWGGKRCEFDWNQPLQDPALLDNKKQQLGREYVRDFNFHTGHVFTTISDALVCILGEEGGRAVSEAVKEFSDIFGAEYLLAAVNSYRT